MSNEESPVGASNGMPSQTNYWALGIALVMKIRRVLSRNQSKCDLGGWIQKKRLGVIKDKCICPLLHALRNT